MGSSQTIAIILRFDAEKPEHQEWDSNARFLSFLPKAQALQPERPLVWFGDTLHEV